MYLKLTSIEMSPGPHTIEPTGIFGGSKPGAMVAVKPCGEKWDGKTYLGMYLCSAPQSVIGRQVGEKIIVEFAEYTNPAIYIPELDEIVWGSGSWWGPIKDESQLKEITNEDIANTWYVRALSHLNEKAGE